MPKFRPRLRTSQEDARLTKTQKNLKTNKKIQNIHLRYSHIPIARSSQNTLYSPLRNLKRTKQTKRKPIQPSGSSWELMLKELNKPFLKKKSNRKYHETMKPVSIHSKTRKPVLKHRVTTTKENVSALEKELARDNRLEPLGTKI